jgi:hypothetical protein
MKPTKLVADCSTGIVEEIELTEEEIAEREALAAQIRVELDAQKVLDDAKAVAKASAEAKLAALGLTAEEIAAL